MHSTSRTWIINCAVEEAWKMLVNSTSPVIGGAGCNMGLDLAHHGASYCVRYENTKYMSYRVRGVGWDPWLTSHAHVGQPVSFAFSGFLRLWIGTCSVATKVLVLAPTTGVLCSLEAGLSGVLGPAGPYNMDGGQLRRWPAVEQPGGK